MIIFSLNKLVIKSLITNIIIAIKINQDKFAKINIKNIKKAKFIYFYFGIIAKNIVALILILLNFFNKVF